MLKRIMVIGSGGREAAIVWRLKLENPGAEIYVAPGSAAIAKSLGVFYAAIDATDVTQLTEFAVYYDVDLVVCGPEASLVAGIGDCMEERGILFCGPTSLAAYLSEGSKAAFKRIMMKHGITTTPYGAYTDYKKALDRIDAFGAKNIVIKADGLVTGKGVFLPDDKFEAERIVRNLLHAQTLGPQGMKIVIEDRIRGPEYSAIGVTDGVVVRPLPFTQDHKRAWNGDRGPNTGGMGAHTVHLPRELEQKALGLMEKAVHALAEEGHLYRGFIYLGLMDAGDLYVLEANSRLGNPETQCILPVLGGSFTELCLGAALGDLSGVPQPTQEGESLTVVMSSAEYPGKSERDELIQGIDEAQQAGALVFHAGTSFVGNQYRTNKAGRVLDVVGVDQTLAGARIIAYRGAGMIHAGGALRYRSDIGSKALCKKK